MSTKFTRASNQYISVPDGSGLTFPRDVAWTQGFIIVFDGVTSGDNPQALISTASFGAGGSYNVVYYTSGSSILAGKVAVYCDVAAAASPTVQTSEAFSSGAYLFVVEHAVDNTMRIRHCPILAAQPTDSSAVVTSYNGGGAGVLDGTGGLFLGNLANTPANRALDQSLSRVFYMAGTLTDIEVANLAWGKEITDLGKSPKWYFRLDKPSEITDRGSQGNATSASSGLTLGTSPGFGYTTPPQGNSGMTILAQDTFDTDTAGAIAPGFTAKTGTWSVGTVGAVSGSQSFGATSNTDGDFALHTGVASRSGSRVTIACKLTSNPSSGTNTYYPALRMDSAYQNGYLFAPETATVESRLRLYKRAGGSFSVIAESAFDFSSWAVGDVMMLEASDSGTSFEFRVWKASGTRPSIASLATTDSSFATGQTGMYRAGQSKPAAAVDNFVLEDNTVAVVAPGTPVIGTAVAGDGYVDVAFTASASGGAASMFAATLSTGESSTGSVSPIRVAASNGSARTGHVTATNNGGTSAASAESNSVTPTAAPGSITYPITNTNIYFSPFNWFSNGASGMQSNNIRGASTLGWSNMRGSYLKFRATVGVSGTISLGLNTGTLNSVNAAGCPQIMWSVANGAWQSHTLSAGESALLLAAGLGAGTYDVFVVYRGVFITQDGQNANYNEANNRFQVTGLTVSAGGTLSPPPVRSKTMAAFGDSITEGDLSNGGPRSAVSQDASLTYGWLLAEALDAEVGIIGFYGMNWAWFDSTWPNYASGLSRLISGRLAPAPDFVTINYGENDGDPGPAASVVSATLASISASAPTAKIINLIPFSGRARANLSAATLPANGYRVDLAPLEMLNGKMIWSYDGQHPNPRGHANLAALLSNKVNALGGLPLTARTVTVTLGIDSNTPAANLAGLRVSYFDEATPDLHTVARYKTAAGTTNSSGVLSFSAQSTLSAGGTGYLVVQGAGGVHYNAPVVVA